MKNIKITIRDKDLRPLLIEGEGEIRKYNLDVTTEELKPYWLYLIALCKESYIAGINRTVDEFNKDADREASRAQSRAIKRLMKDHIRDLNE